MKYLKKSWKWDFLLSNKCKIRANEDKGDSNVIKGSAENIPKVRDDEGPDVEDMDEGQDEHSMGNVFFLQLFLILSKFTYDEQNLNKL